MKEFIEIQLSEQFGLETDQILKEKFLYFDSTINSSTRAKFSGRLISVEKGVLTLSSQMCYEKIPLSEMNEGTSIELFNNFKKERSLGEAKVISRYLIGTKKTDWKIEKEIDLNNSDEIDLNFELGLKEKEVLELGELPLSMDDKWFLYVEGNIFHYFRSWTGVEIYRGEIAKHELDKDKWIIKNVIVSKEFNSSLDEKKNLIHDLLKYGISRKLKLIDV